MPALAEPSFFDTPIFILNFNHLAFLSKQIAWLLGAGYRNVTVLDNDSTYPPLLRYYADMTSSGAIAVVRRPRNDSKVTVWNEHLLALDRPFVFTSSDIVPDECCPVDAVARLASHLRDNPQLVKAGLGLRIDDLPARYKHRREVLIKQSEYWRAPAGRGVFLAPIDTTFALYRRGAPFVHEPAVRTSWPYLARHEPWYSDSANRTEEEQYYAATIAPGRGSWGRAELPEWMLATCAKLAADPRTLVHLACGRDAFPGWINVDAGPDTAADVSFDLDRCAEGRLPIDDDSVDGFFMGPAFARIQRLGAMLEALYRVARPDARFVIRVDRGTSDRSPGAAARRYGPRSFHEFGQPAHTGGADPYAADWRVARILLIAEPALAGSMSDADVLARMGGERDIVCEMVVELRAVKPPRPRGSRLLECPAPTVSWCPLDPDSQF